MPVLPTAEDVFGKRPVPQTGRSVIGYKAGQEAESAYKAGQALASTGDVLQEAVKKRNDEIKKFDLVRSQSFALKEYTALEQSLLNDPDYDTHIEKYTAQSEKINAAALSLIKDPETRELYSYDLKNIQTNGLSSVNKNIYNKQNDHLRGEHIVMQDDLSRAAAFHAQQGDLSVLDVAIKKNADAVDILYKTGAIDYETAEKSKLVFQDKIATDVFTALPLEKQRDLVSVDAPLSVRNNNPGNIRDPSTGEFMKFSSKEDGMAAMRRDLSVKISGKSKAMEADHGKGYVPSIRNILSTYAPPSENDTNSYIATVVKDTGIDPDKALSESDIDKVMSSMIKVEGGVSASKSYGGILNNMSVDTQNRMKAHVASQLKENEDQVVLSFVDNANKAIPLDMTDPMFVTLNESNQKKVIEYYKRASGQLPKTLQEDMDQDREFTELYSKIATGEQDPSAMTAGQLIDLSTKLKPEDFNKIATMVNSSKKGIEQNVPMGLIETVSDNLARDILVKDDVTVDAQRLSTKKASLVRAIAEKTERFVIANNRPPTREEVYSMGDSFLKDVVFKVPGSWGGIKEVKMKAYQFLSPNAIETFTTNNAIQIPQPEVDNILRSIKEKFGDERFNSMTDEEKVESLEKIYIQKLIVGDE